MKTATREFINIVESFVQDKKITQETLQSVLSDAVAHYSGVKHENVVKVGKPLTDHSADIRQKIIKLAEERKGRLFTSPELAAELGTDVATTNNNLRYLAKNQGILSIIGRSENEKGQRGRAPIIWKFKS